MLKTSTIIAGGLSFAAVGGLVLGTSSAAFSGTTKNEGNSVSAATVSLTDNDNDIALFSVVNAVPGDTVSKCIVVEYTGSTAADVALFSTVGGTLAPYVNTVITDGATTDADCNTFVADQNVFTGTLTALGTHSDYATGLGMGNWRPQDAAPAAGVETANFRTYQVTVTIADDNAAQGKSATFDLTWEARNI